MKLETPLSSLETPSTTLEKPLESDPFQQRSRSHHSFVAKALMGAVTVSQEVTRP